MKHRRPLLLLLSTLGVIVSFFFIRMFTINATGAYVSHQHVWSDWGLHIAMTNAFATKDPSEWFVTNPVFAGGKFTYPFLTNLIAATLMRLGSSLAVALIVPSIIYVQLLIVGLYFFTYLLTRDRGSAVLSVYLIFLSGGMGFLRFIDELRQRPVWQTVTAMPDFYTSYHAYQWYAGNFVSGFLLPQRAFLLGVTVGVWVCVLLLYSLNRSFHSSNNKLRLLLAGMLAGLLPIIHMHTFIVITVCCAVLLFSNISRWKMFALFGIPATIISSLLFVRFVAGGIGNSHFFSWLPGYTSSGGVIGWLWMWWQLWGVFLPLAGIGACLLTKRNSRALFIGFVFLFALANTILFQPVPWDNSKIFLWVYIGLSPAVAVLLTRLWRKSISVRLVAISLLLCLCLSGFLDVVRIFQEGKYSFQLNSREEVDLGLLVRERTAPNAIFATAARIQEPILAWGARPILMSYWAWAWNFGFDHEQREADIRTIFLGGPAALATLEKLHVSYVLIGPAERSQYHANEEFYQSQFPVALSTHSYQVFDVRSHTQQD